MDIADQAQDAEALFIELACQAVTLAAPTLRATGQCTTAWPAFKTICASATPLVATISLTGRPPRRGAGSSGMDDHKIERLHRRLTACSSPHAIVLRSDKFYLVEAESPRLAGILNTPAWVGRVIGVFSPDVPIEVLRDEVAA